jgi:hypothetical protein
MMVTNTSSATIQGPIETVLSNLSANAAMVNAMGTSNGSPYIKVSSAPLAPGATASVQIQFTNPTNGFINFTPVTLSGAL